MPADCWDTLEKLRQLVEYAESLAFLAEPDLLGLLVAKSDAAKRWATHRKKFTTKEKELKGAQTATNGWRQKLSLEDTTTALLQMRTQEKSIARFLSPSWWQLRGIMQRSYDFKSHQVQPTYSHVLELLQREHQVAAELEKLEPEARDEFFFDGAFRDFSDRVAALIDAVDGLPAYLQAFHRYVVPSPHGDETVLTLAVLKSNVARLLDELENLLADTKELSLGQIRDETKRIAESLDALPGFAPCLKELSAMPAPLAKAWRRFPLQTEQLEAAIAERTIDDVLHADPPLARFNSTVQGTHLAKLEQIHDQWHSISAKSVRDRVCRRFLEHVRIASLPHGQLTPEQKEFKVLYNRGRRELEHEFNGKATSGTVNSRP